MSKHIKIAACLLLLLLATVCWAGGNKDKGVQQPKAGGNKVNGEQQNSAKQPERQAATQAGPSPFFTGDGGKDKSIAILAPTTTGLAENQNYLPSLVQGEFVSNFTGFSAISVLDRVRLDEQYAELFTGYYDDNAEGVYDLGHLAPTDYIMGGSITRTQTGYAMQIQITKSADKMTVASHSGTFTFTELDNLSGIRRASLDLLQKMGVTPTERTRTELSAAAQANYVSAQTNLAQGITAQQQGTVVEALSRYIQSTNYDPTLAEAASRLNILTANVTSGNIGSDVRNDLAWRDQWVARLKECEEFYTNYMKEIPPYYLVYDENISRGAVDYEKRTVPLGITINAYPDPAYFETINRVVETVRQGLEATGRAETWKLKWPQMTFSSENGIKAVEFHSPFQDYVNAWRVTVEIVNSNGKVIAAEDPDILYGWQWIWKTFLDQDDSWRISGNAKGVSSKIDVEFPAVDPGADSLTDTLSIRIAKINGVSAGQAAERRNISILPASEFLASGKAKQSEYFIYCNMQRNRYSGPDYKVTGDRRNSSSYTVYSDKWKNSPAIYARWIIPAYERIKDDSRSWIQYIVIHPSVKTYEFESNFSTGAQVIIGANVDIKIIRQGGPSSPSEFAAFYNRNGKKAGRYVLVYPKDSVGSLEWTYRPFDAF